MANIICFYLIFLFFWVCEGTLRLYDMPDFNGEFFQVKDIHFGMQDIPFINTTTVASVRTTECVVLIEHSGSMHDINVAIQPPGTPDLGSIEAIFKPNKFAMCEDFYGPKYKKRGIIATFGEIKNVSLAEVRGCFTFPKSGGPLSRIYNFGNCIDLYQNENCHGDKFNLRGGVSKNSFELLPMYKSMSHCFTCPLCPLLNATVVGLTLSLFNETELMNRTVDMDSSLAFLNINARYTTITQVYTAKTRVRERIEMVRPQYLQEMNAVNLSPFFEYFSNSNLTHISSLVKTTLVEAYKKPVKNYPQEVYAKEKFKSYSVSQNGTFDVCSLVNINSYVRVAENYPVMFELIFEVADAEYPSSIPFDVIRDSLSQVFEEDLSSEIVGGNLAGIVVKFTGMLLATFGQEQLIETTGKGGYDQYCMWDERSKVLKVLYDDEQVKFD